jgi:hypothetical protein
MPLVLEIMSTPSVKENEAIAGVAFKDEGGNALLTTMSPVME